MTTPAILSQWRRMSNGRVATLVAVRGDFAVLRFKGSSTDYFVRLIDGTPRGYERVEPEPKGGRR